MRITNSKYKIPLDEFIDLKGSINLETRFQGQKIIQIPTMEVVGRKRCTTGNDKSFMPNYEFNFIAQTFFLLNPRGFS